MKDPPETIRDNDTLFRYYNQLSAATIVCTRIRLRVGEEHLLTDLAERGIPLIPSATAQLASRSKVFQARLFRDYMLPGTCAIYDTHTLLNTISLYQKQKITQVILKRERKNAGLGVHLFSNKKDLESLLKSYLFYPLDLNSIQISSDKLSNASLTPGYNLAMKKSIPLKFSSFQAAVGMRSTLEDLMKFCQYKIGQSYPDKYKRKIGFFQGAGISRKLYFENGWYIIKSKKGKFIYSHSGRTNGHSAYMHFIPETKTGVVLLANSAKGTEDLSLLILRLINNYKI